MPKKALRILLLISLSILMLISLPTVLAIQYEDFTTYVEVDPLETIDVTSSRITVDDLSRDESAWVMKDKGVDWIESDEDFEHWITVKEITHANDEGFFIFWAVWNDVPAIDKNLKECIDGNFEGLVCSCFYDTDTWKLFYRIAEYRDGVADYQQWNGASENTVYYIIIDRIGTTVRMRIYSDSDRETLAATLTVTVTAETYRYLFATQTYNDGKSTKTIDAYCENLDLREVVITFYLTTGGQFWIDNISQTNGTETKYYRDSIISLMAVIKNSSYRWWNFTFFYDNETTNAYLENPYNYVISADADIWCYYGWITAENGEIEYQYFYGVFIIPIALGLLGLALTLKRHSTF